MTADVRTFCRVCEPACGLVAETDGDRLIALRPDREHPVTAGYACHKGLAMLDIHHDPDRLDHPMHRSATGEWEAQTWDEATASIAGALTRIIDEHGPRSVAIYTGNPLAFNTLAFDGIAALARGLGVTRTFSSGTQDCANKFAASEAVFGSSTIHPIPDLEHTDLCLVIGGNPRVSQGSFFSIPNVVREMKQASSRGARFVFVNPRRIETAERGIGDTMQIRPDTDLYFLAALLHEIDRRGGWRNEVLRTHATHVEQLRAFIEPYDADTTAAVTGIAAAALSELADAWVAAKAASVYASTGVNMGRQGTLAYWLVQMLSFTTGNLDRSGGNLKSDGFYPNARAGAAPAAKMYAEVDDWGVLRRGSLPGNLMADAIVDAAQPVRAMIVVAGNPVLSIGGGDRLTKALEQLDVLVCIDLYRNATGELATHLLPAADMLEREDLNVTGVGLSQKPFVQFTAAVVPPGAERKTEWWACQRLLQAMGKPCALDDENIDPWSKWQHMVERGTGIDLDDLKRDPRPVALAVPEPGRFFDAQIQTDDGKVDCCPATFAAALARAGVLFAEMAAEPPGLKLIHRRDTWMMNSWFHNVERMQRGGRTDNPLFMHPDDAVAHGLADGDRARVWNGNGEVIASVAIDPDLRAGVVAMVHGWGNKDTTGMRNAQASPGVNCNALLPSGPDSFERLSSQAHMTGIPVEVAALG